MLFVGVEFGARMINIDGKQIKLQIWDTVSCGHVFWVWFKRCFIGWTRVISFHYKILLQRSSRCTVSV